jgi:hypothetical protein
MADVAKLKALLAAVVDLNLAHLDEAAPVGYEHWDDVYENNVQVTGWTAWQREVRAALAE